MSEAEAREVADEQIAWWKRKHIRPRRACQAMGIRPRKYSWGEARAYMVRWWLRNHDA